MSRRINSRLVYDLLKNASKIDSRVEILSSLLIFDQNNIPGQFVSGMSKSAGNCYWVTDKSWFNQMDMSLKKADQIARRRSKDGYSAFTHHTYSVVLNAYRSNEYENNPQKAIEDILAICKDAQLPRRQMRYLNKRCRKLEEIIGFIVKECEKSHGQPQQIEEEEEAGELTLENIRLFLEGGGGRVFFSFGSEEAFLSAVFPQACLREPCFSGIAPEDLMDRTCPASALGAICDLLMFDGGYRLRRLEQSCALLTQRMAHTAHLYPACMHLIERHIPRTEMAGFLRDCVSRCAEGRYPHRALAVLAVYALLGDAQFERLIPDAWTAKERLCG